MLLYGARYFFHSLKYRQSFRLVGKTNDGTFAVHECRVLRALTSSTCSNLKRDIVSNLVAALRVCSSSRDLERGKIVHADATEKGKDSNIYVATTLVDMYAKCGSMLHARSVFDKMPRHTVVSWTALMLGYAENGQGESALQLFSNMQSEGCEPNSRTIVALLKACSSLAAKEQSELFDGNRVKRRCLRQGMAIHFLAKKRGCDSDIFVANTLVDMYAKCGSMPNALMVFNNITNRNVVSWTILILGYVDNSESEVALNLFAQMQPEGCQPDARTFLAALKACSSLAAKEEAKYVDGKLTKWESLQKGVAIHSDAAKMAYDCDIFVANILIDMYGKCMSMVNAQKVFDKIARPSVVSWSAMILGYADNGDGELALKLFSRMQREGCVPDGRTFVAALKACTSLAAKEESKKLDGRYLKKDCLEKGRAIHYEASRRACDSEMFVANTLIDMYAKCGSMEDAHAVFDRMPHRDVISWNALMIGYAEAENGKLTLHLYVRMSARDAGAFVGALIACGGLTDLETGKQVHAEIWKYGLQGDAFVAACLVDFYGKCGNPFASEQVFNLVPARDVVIWNALIAGYSRQGNTQRVFDLFQRMREEGLQANCSTFLAVLTACSHAGLVDKGKEYFQAMCSEYGIIPLLEHYSCFIDLLGRANQLDDALVVVNSMPFKPNTITWITILGAAMKWKNLAVGRFAFKSLRKLDEKQAAAYVNAVNASMWEELSKA